MEHLSIQFIRHFVETHVVAVYFVIILGIILEGEIVVIFAGIFSHLGSINPFIAFGCVIIGGSLRSVIGYSFGFYLGKCHAEKYFINKIGRKISSLFPNFEKKPFWSIFISRFFVFGLSWFTLVYSGFKKIPVKIFIKAEAMSLSLWSVFMLTLGYFFSYTALSISRDIFNFISIIILLLVGFFILEKIAFFVLRIIESTYDKNNFLSVDE